MARLLRTFVAVALTSDVRKALADAIRELSGCDARVRWTMTANLHVTLKFLGNTPEGDVPDVCRLVCEAAEGLEPFDIEIAGLGSFPARKRPRVIWAGARLGAKELSTLEEGLQARLQEAGFPAENRRYVPHVTLGRVLGGNARRLASLIEERKEELYGDFLAEAITYYRSELKREGPVYTVLATAELGRSSQP